VTLPRLVSASANPHKVAEIAALLEGLVHLLPRPDGVPEVVEDAGSLEGNARLKASAICAATGLPAVSDDTGLFVDALDGEPGVDTAYYAGPNATYAENRAKLLRALEGVADRRARFRTVVMVVHPDGTHRRRRARRTRIRVRPGVRAGRRRWPNLQRDDRGREELDVASRAGIRRAGARAQPGRMMA